MITKIRKRDGREVPFNIEKIANAIFKAAQSVGGQDYESSLTLADQVAIILNEEFKDGIPNVEDIQDIVEKVLIENGHAKTAKEYILYRAERNRSRDMNTRLMKVYGDLTFKPGEYREDRARSTGSDRAMATMLRYGSEGAKEYNDLFVLNPAHSKAHKSGDIYIHDLDYLALTTSSCQIDITRLFKGGFGRDSGLIKEPDNIRSYGELACLAIQSNQNDQHGGQGIGNFDYAMAEGVRKSYQTLYRENLLKAIELLVEGLNLEDNINNIFKLLEKEYSLVARMGENRTYQKKEGEYLKELLGDEVLVVKAQSFARKNSYREIDIETYRAMECLVYNLNTLRSRAGAQLPFSTINYGTDTSEEGRMVIRNLLKLTEKGLGNGKTTVFPIQVFKVKEGVNYREEDPNYDLFKLACRVSSKRLLPNFSFIDAPFNLKYYREGRPETEVAYMGDRTRLIANVYDREQEIISGRGNLSLTTINLPRLGLRNRGDLRAFYRELDRTIDLTIEQLLERFEIQASKTVANFPFLMGEGVWLDSASLELDDEIREVLKHGSLAIGFVGLAECLKALIGKHHGESTEAQRLGLEIIGHMRKRMDETSQQFKMNFLLMATPGLEDLRSFVEMDREEFGAIEGVTNMDYYTNSFHIPLYYSTTVLEKIQLEAAYHSYTNGGHISYIELDDGSLNDLDAVETTIRTMKEEGIGYGAIIDSMERTR